MKEIFFKKATIFLFAVAIIFGIGYFLRFENSRDILTNGSALFTQSWNEVFAASKDSFIDLDNSTSSAIENDKPTVISKKVQKSSAKTLAACWETERDDLENLEFLLKESNAGITALTKKMHPISTTCSTSSPVLASSSNLDTSFELSEQEALSEDFLTPEGDVAPVSCPISDVAELSGPIILNEIAWMGSPSVPGESATKASAREWIELKNISNDSVNLNGWQISDSAGKFKIVFNSNDLIAPGELYLLVREGSSWSGDVVFDKQYKGALSNTGLILAIFDNDCGISDFIDASKGWPGGNNKTKQTFERGNGGIWQTSALPGGTPKHENSAGIIKYDVSIAIQGDGLGKIITKPTGISCNSVTFASDASGCSAKFTQGTSIVLTATPGRGAMFRGWSGGCSGSASTCTLTVAGTVSIAATFQSGLSVDASDLAASTALEDGSQNIASTVTTGDSLSVRVDTTSTSEIIPQSFGHLLITQIQIAGASTANDFVKFFNPTASTLDLGGWKLRKKSSTGSEYSLRELPKGSLIDPGTSFIWANSSGGFAQSMGADFSSSETLSADNSIALFDASGVLVDAVAWGKGINQYIQGLPYPTNPTANQILYRKSGDGLFVDTGNNADDFTL